MHANQFVELTNGDQIMNNAFWIGVYTGMAEVTISAVA